LSKKHRRQVHKNEFHAANCRFVFLRVLWLNDTSYSKEVNRKLLAKDTTAVQLFTVYTDPDYHNAQRYRQ